MQEHRSITRSALHAQIRNRAIRFAGNKKLKIYGLLSCGSGKKMKAVNRVFFADESEAKSAGYRPCGHCMRMAYEKWKTDHQSF